jgi:hypothetical protein
MANDICSQCEKPIGASELFCPHCGAAQVPQYSRGQLQAALGREREGKTRLPAGLGCLIGLLVGVATAVLADQMGWLLPGERLRYQQHAEIVLALAIAGLIAGQVVAILRSRSAARRAGSRRREEEGNPDPRCQT